MARFGDRTRFGKHLQMLSRSCPRKAQLGQTEIYWGDDGLRAYIQLRILSSETAALKQGYAPIRTGESDIFDRIKSQFVRGNLSDVLTLTIRCAACPQRELPFLSGHMDHDHRTGEFRGLIEAHTNKMEGYLASYTEVERAQVILFFYPETSGLIYNEILRRRKELLREDPTLKSMLFPGDDAVI